MIDFEQVRACPHLKIYVSATNVETGRVKVFERHELTADMVMASACLPLVFQAVEIDGVPYWDGGYMGNPALFPFFNASESDDVIVVQINPIFRRGAPKSAREILNRVNRSEEHTSELQSLMRISYAVFCLQKKTKTHNNRDIEQDN